MPTDQHRQSPTNYQSGHCEVGRHEACRGIYAGVTCTCGHHTAPPPELDLLPVLGDPAAAIAEVLTVVHHCSTCTCAVTP